MTLIKLLEDIKKGSSRWIKEQGSYFEQFFWQEGYAAVSVSPPELERVVEYVRNQKSVHRYLSYKEELLKFLEENNISYDERFLWR